MKYSLRVPLALAAVLLSGPTCRKAQVSDEWHSNSSPAPPANMAKVEATRAAKDMPHPRLVLTKEALQRVRRHAKADTDLWKQVSRQCRMYSEKDLSSGYLGGFWGDAVINLTLCWHGTGERAWQDKAFHYLNALLDDKSRIGDGAGGDTVIQRNKGYPIRNHGFHVALAYDWLYNAPGMTPALRDKMVARLGAWLSWYGDEGYLNDSIYANYYWGYMSTLSLAGLALHGDAPVAEKWLKTARDTLQEVVVPGFYHFLRGGEWAEGWQYGQLVAVEVALVVRAFATATGSDFSKNMPWFAGIVDSRLHRLRPDKNSEYGNGTQNDNPAPPRAESLYAALLVLESSDPKRAEHARFLLRELFPSLRGVDAWIGVVADDPDGTPRSDPRATEPLSYFVAGAGQSFSRSSWEPAATWVSFQAGPKIAIDHQNQDQGHFEIWRGGDGLLVDAGAEHASATTNHNTLLIDDGRKLLRYAPNQGVWGKKVATTGFADDGEVVVHVGDLADAWSPKCVKIGCDDREVTRAQRTLVYLRKHDVVVTDDIVDVVNATTKVAWGGHVRALPQIDGAQVRASFGQSQVGIDFLLPENVSIAAPKAEEFEGNHPFKANRPAFDAWRIEAQTATGTTSRRLRAWIQVGAAGAQPRGVRAVSGIGLSGGASDGIAVVFADGAAGGNASLPKGTNSVVVVGLKPEESYQVSFAACAFTVAKGSGTKTTSAGFLRASLPSCP